MSTQLSELDRRVTDLCLEFQGSYRFEHSVFVPTAANLASLVQRAEALQAEVSAAAADGDPIWCDHLLEILDVLTFRLEEDLRYPYRFLAGVVGTIDDLTALDTRPVAVRAAVLAEKLPHALDLFPVLLGLLSRLGEDRQDQVAEYAQALQRVVATALGTTAAWHKPSVTMALGALEEATAGFVGALEAGVKRSDLLPDFPFAVTLRRGYGIELDDLLSWYEQDIAQKQAELEALAESISPGKTAFAILADELPAYPAPEQMFEPMRQYVAMAREACRRYISLPEGEVCEVADVPDQLKRSYPWGGFSGGNPLLGELNGQVFLNSANYQAVTKGWLAMMAVHECYPGHHAQRVKTAAGKLPESFKLGGFRMAKAVPLNEGIAHRAEEMFQDLFPERAYPIFVKLRQLHTAVRIKAEISLHHLKRPRQAVVDLYVKHLGFSPQSADGQVRYGEIWPGYFCCYYYGHKQLEALKAKYGVPEPDFTELTFACGYVSLDTVAKLLALDAPARAAYLNGQAFGL
jgi:uncharacterized protein (DUF885 family)